MDKIVTLTEKEADFLVDLISNPRFESKAQALWARDLSNKLGSEARVISIQTSKEEVAYVVIEFRDPILADFRDFGYNPQEVN